MAPRKSRKRKASTDSLPNIRILYAQPFTGDAVWKPSYRIRLLQSCSRAAQLSTEEELPDHFVHAVILNEGVFKFGGYLQRMTTQPGPVGEYTDLFWSLGSSWMPDPDSNARKVQSIYEGRIHHLETKLENLSAIRRSKPFLETNFGRLPPEIRVLIFTNLLASPPPYSGRDLRVAQIPTAGRSPRPITTFVNLKESSFAILQTCRQTYREAFPVFYANKSYYTANAQDLVTVLSRNPVSWSHIFRLDTINSLCISNLVVKRPRWNSEQIENLMSSGHTFSREQLQAEQNILLEPQLLTGLNFEEMKGLQIICICMQVGHECEYLRFLFNISGLGRGVIEFTDDFHWSISSQSGSTAEWKLQYTPFSYSFYRKGRDYQRLSYEQVRIQEDMVNIDSRASDLTEGDERWVEIDIGARNYEEKEQMYQHDLRLAQDRVSQSQQGTPSEEAVRPLGEDESDRMSDHLDESAESEADGVETDIESDQNSEDEQVQRDGQENDATDDEPDWGSNYPQNPANIGDHEAQAEPNLAANTSATLSNQYDFSALLATVPNEESADLTAAESNQETNGSLELSDDEDIYAQTGANNAPITAIVVEEVGGQIVEAQPEEIVRATTDASPISRHRDTGTQTVPVKANTRDVETQTEPEGSSQELQGSKLRVSPALAVLLPGKDASHQPQARDRQQVPARPRERAHQKSESSVISQSEKGSATKSPPKAMDSSNPQQTNLDAEISALLRSRVLRRPELLRTDVEETPRSSPTKIQVAIFMLALYLLYALLSVKVNGTLIQLVVLFTSILLFFLSACI